MVNFFREMYHEAYAAAMSQAFTGDASVMFGAAVVKIATLCRQRLNINQRVAKTTGESE